MQSTNFCLTQQRLAPRQGSGLFSAPSPEMATASCLLLLAPAKSFSNAVHMCTCINRAKVSPSRGFLPWARVTQKRCVQSCFEHDLIEHSSLSGFLNRPLNSFGCKSGPGNTQPCLCTVPTALLYTDYGNDMLQVNLTKIWYTFSSLLLSMTFVFGNSIKNTYESVIFLFVVHPFDVGDGVYIGTGQTDFYTVSCPGYDAAIMSLCMTTAMLIATPASSHARTSVWLMTSMTVMPMTVLIQPQTACSKACLAKASLLAKHSLSQNTSFFTFQTAVHQDATCPQNLVGLPHLLASICLRSPSLAAQCSLVGLDPVLTLQSIGHQGLTNIVLQHLSQTKMLHVLASARIWQGGPSEAPTSGAGHAARWVVWDCCTCFPHPEVDQPGSVLQSTCE